MGGLDWGYTDERHCVLRYVAGPHLYGIDDPLPAVREEVAVVIEPPECLIDFGGFHPLPYETDGLRLTQLSLREFMRRILDGNLTTMLPILAPERAVLYSSQVGRDLFSKPTDLLGERLQPSLIGYLRATRRELSCSADLSRPYDPELAFVLLRVGHQGLEALRDETVTLPVPEPLRSRLREVRSGRADVDGILSEIDELIGMLELAPLRMQEPPASLCYRQALVRIYLEHWNRTWQPLGLE